MRSLFVLLNVLGGLAILGSYAHGLWTDPDPGRAWGGLPNSLRGLYTTSMPLAAAGYFAMTSYVLFRAGPRSWPLYLALYALILLPSALWLPLTFAYLDAESVDAQSAPLWWAVQGVLFLVAIGSLGLVAALVVHPPRRATLWWALAILGAIAFAFQTVVLDALVWPAYVS